MAGAVTKGSVLVDWRAGAAASVVVCGKPR